MATRDPLDHSARPTSRANTDDDGIRVPGSPPPLGSERTDVNPGHEAGVDELPANDGQTPASTDEAQRIRSRVPDIDPDNAERTDAPNPR